MAREGSIYSELESGKINAEGVADGVAEREISPACVFGGLSNKRPRVKFGCSKALLILSEKHPELLSGHIDAIAERLDGNNRILKWNAIAILGNLAASDAGERVRDLADKLCGLMAEGELITANNAIAALGKIARANPGARKRITEKLLAIERQHFETGECRNIAIGKAIMALEMFCDPANAGKPVLDFISRQMGNSRNATAHKAKAFMRSMNRAIEARSR
jgi:hypothetical protein